MAPAAPAPDPLSAVLEFLKAQSNADFALGIWTACRAVADKAHAQKLAGATLATDSPELLDLDRAYALAVMRETRAGDAFVRTTDAMLDRAAALHETRGERQSELYPLRGLLALLPDQLDAELRAWRAQLEESGEVDELWWREVLIELGVSPTERRPLLLSEKLELAEAKVLEASDKRDDALRALETAMKRLAAAELLVADLRAEREAQPAPAVQEAS